MSNPPFIQIQGQMQMPPDYVFKKVGIRGFPLAASYKLVKKLVDLCLNDFGGGKLDYRPIQAPGGLTIVYMQLASYGSMACTSPPFAAWGWMSQNEINFTVPLLHYQNGSLVDISFFCPFLFVDNAWSIITGNMVMGFPKGLATFQLPDEINHPYPTEIKTAVFPVFDPGTPLTWERWITITQADGESATAGMERYWPFGDVEGLFGARGRFAVDVEILERLKAVSRSGFFKVVQLRQIRDLDDHKLAAYSSIVSLTVQLDALHGQGLLAPAKIEIRPFASLLVGKLLGIAPSLSPIIPFWVDLDFGFQKPEVLHSDCSSGEGQSRP
jgi:hypothetical protein